jgi:hypothetical protein
MGNDSQVWHKRVDRPSVPSPHGALMTATPVGSERSVDPTRRALTAYFAGKRTVVASVIQFASSP